MIRNNDFYDRNAQRSYPIDDAATCTDDAGGQLPPGIIVDMSLRFPVTAGNAVCLAALTVTDKLVTAVFAAFAMPASGSSTSPTIGSGAFSPIAAVTVLQPVVPGAPYTLTPLLDGAGGWIVFGDTTDVRYSGRFSQITQSQILLRQAMPYTDPPVKSLGLAGHDSVMRGMLTLAAGNDMEVFSSTRKIDGFELDVIVLRLKNSLNRNVYQIYSGPCGGRPESRSCPQAPLESLTHVQPDCDGVITIQVKKAAVLPLANGHGVVLDLPVGMPELCGDRFVPKDGHLPYDFDNYCSSESSLSSHSSSESSQHGIPPPTNDSPPECDHADFCDDLANPDLTGWTVADGDLRVVAGPDAGTWCNTQPATPGVLQAFSTAGRNTLVSTAWNPCGNVVDTDQRFSAMIQALATPINSYGIVGGLVLNWRLVPPTNRPHYLLAGFDAAFNRLGIWSYNGNNISLLTGFDLTGSDVVLVPETWYFVTVLIQHNVTGASTLNLEIYEANGANPLATLTVTTKLFGEPTGTYGVGTIQSLVQFAKLSLTAQ